MFRTHWQNRQHFNSYLLDRQPAINFAQQASLLIKSNQGLSLFQVHTDPALNSFRFIIFALVKLGSILIPATLDKLYFS
jgi:hypothetical protein